MSLFPFILRGRAAIGGVDVNELLIAGFSIGSFSVAHYVFFIVGGGNKDKHLIPSIACGTFAGAISILFEAFPLVVSFCVALISASVLSYLLESREEDERNVAVRRG